MTIEVFRMVDITKGALTGIIVMNPRRGIIREVIEGVRRKDYHTNGEKENGADLIAWRMGRFRREHPQIKTINIETVPCEMIVKENTNPINLTNTRVKRNLGVVTENAVTVKISTQYSISCC